MYMYVLYMYMCYALKTLLHVHVLNLPLTAFQCLLIPKEDLPFSLF
jgi:hypothetical protein